MISLYIIAGFFLAIAALEFTVQADSDSERAANGRAGLWSAFIAAFILAFVESARATGVF